MERSTRDKAPTSFQTETVELAQDLSQLAAWGGNNALARFVNGVFPFAGFIAWTAFFHFARPGRH